MLAMGVPLVFRKYLKSFREIGNYLEEKQACNFTVSRLDHIMHNLHCMRCTSVTSDRIIVELACSQTVTELVYGVVG